MQISLLHSSNYGTEYPFLSGNMSGRWRFVPILEDIHPNHVSNVPGRGFFTILAFGKIVTTFKPHFIMNLLENIILASAMLSPCLAHAMEQTEWHDPLVNAINRAPMHTSYFAYSSAEEAAAGC